MKTLLRIKTRIITFVETLITHIMKFTFLIIILFISQNILSQIYVLIGDTIEMTKEVRKEYAFRENIEGKVIKINDIKHLIVTKVEKDSEYVLLKNSDQEKTEKPIIQLEQSNLSNTESIKLAGLYLEKAGKQKNGAYTAIALTLLAGVGVAVFTENYIVGYITVGVGQLIGLGLNIAGNKNMKRAGVLLNSGKLKL